MERKYISRNGVVERTRYAVGDNAAPRGKRKKGNTGFRKQEANFNGAVRQAARIMNCNFSASGGYWCTLSYDQGGLRKLLGKAGVAEREYLELIEAGCGAPETPADGGEADAEERLDEEAAAMLDRVDAAAEHALRLWLRRVKRKLGCAVKAFGVTAEIDGKTGEITRIHHHISVQITAEHDRLEAMAALQAAWSAGQADIRTLREMPDYTPTAVYMLRQVRRREHEQKYFATRGMERPEISEREILGNNEIKAPPGANVLERAEYDGEHIAQYVRYIPKKREKRGGHKREIQEMPIDPA